MTPAPVDHDERRARLTEVLLAVVSESGLEGASIRAVAARAGVSIGTVQHYFADQGRDAAARLPARRRGPRRARRGARRAPPTSVKGAIREVMLELLPLDARRTAALRVSIAFATRALTSPALAAELRRDLRELQDAITAAFAEAGVPEPAREAMLALAVTSGLAEPLLFGDGTVEEVVAALDAYLDRAL